MSDTNKNPNDTLDKVSQKIDERPLDPTRDAEDFLGDITGRTGVTTGDARQVSAEPDDVQKDDSVLPGGTIADPTHTNSTGFTDEEVSDESYDQETIKGMSHVRVDIGNEEASETREAKHYSGSAASDDDPMGTHTAEDADDIPVAESGEETASGTAPSPDSDDDVGAMMEAYTGVDPDPDMDNPQELGVGEEMDEAEEAIRES